ncbi:uncharacterized protein BXZ73DRAFT_104002, partial [Epithele typhae]|uniref:uncharacterized protein n=1 Tax=Epithele typhae TaxID=378194 RepID=UPI002007EE79
MLPSRDPPPPFDHPSFGPTLLVPDKSDTVSVHSTGSATSKRNPWRRPTSPADGTPRSSTFSSKPPGLGKSPPRKNTASGGLASALAASGLAMANPAMMFPPTLAPRKRRRATDARLSTASLAPAPAGRPMNGAASFDDLLLDPEDIPVTGFAVASNKRNQDFHELFPTVPEGDYLIE